MALPLRPSLLLVILLAAGCAAPAQDDPGTAASTATLERAETHDFMGQPREVTFDVPENVGPARVELRIQPCGATATRIALIDPSGAVVQEVVNGPNVSANALGDNDCHVESIEEDLALSPGTWSLRFEGNGASKGSAHVRA